MRSLAPVLLMVVGACSGGSDAAIDDAPRYEYRCPDGTDFVARISSAEEAVVEVNGTTYLLERVPSGSGARYRGGDVDYWSQGEEALLTVGSEIYSGCVTASNG